MDEKKIAWKRVEGKYAWIGVRGRFTFFTLRFSPQHPDAWDNVDIEHAEVPFFLTYHADNGRQEKLKPMKLADAQAHAEAELDSWLAKAGLIEPPTPTLLQHEIDSAAGILKACWDDGIKGMSSDYDRERLAERIALYCVLAKLAEMATIRWKVENENEPVIPLMEARREQLYEVMIDLKERI